MRKMLYFMHIHWNWAKQRPHFIAEHLAKRFSIDVFYEKSFHPEHHAPNHKNENLDLCELQRLPFDRYKYVSIINDWLFRIQLSKRITEFSLIWITHPLIYKRISKIIPNTAILIYDCMDDYLEYTIVKSNQRHLKELFIQEKELMKRANLTFCSSEYLKDKIINRHNLIIDVEVINNALNISHSSPFSEQITAIIHQVKSATSKYCRLITYVGTIDDWMDFDLILQSLSLTDDTVYLMFGPSRVAIPAHPQIIYFGPIPHDAVNPILEISDILVMPFKINELRRSVNSVKLYEYISTCKPIISVRYGETDKFADYVHLYENVGEYMELFKSIIKNDLKAKNTVAACNDFTANNTWECRVNNIGICLNRFLSQN